uniref:Uncharacterized protein n=1 Tax=viral metagenome TaxID=1070528 RepID=A0A2V0RKH5_9ZZZZ
MEKREVSLPAFILGDEVVSELSLVTGPSGSGKSMFLAEANFAKDAIVTDLDKISSRKGDLWLADVSRMKDADIAVGWTDNLQDVAKTLKDGYEDGTPFTLYWIEPGIEVWKATQAAKAREHAAKAGAGDPWTQGWHEKAGYNQARLSAYLAKKLELVIRLVGPDRLVTVTNKVPRRPIVNGWHRSPSKDGAKR